MRQIKRQILFGVSLLLFGLAFARSCYGETPRSLVENSWRYENGEIVSTLNAPEDDGISALSITNLPAGATAEGIDVSEHQKKVDWEAVKSSGIDFAILRLGFGAPSFGGRLDYQFQRNISECERLGIPYGIYIYSYAWDDSQAADEASFVIENLAGHTPQLPVYYDLEDNSIIADGRQAGIASRASIFCNRITQAGYSVGIYANLDWFNNVLTDQVFKSSAWDHWIAQYNYQCDYTGNYSIWQYASDGLVPGVNGYVDMNYSYGSVVAESVKAQRADELASQHAGDLADGTYVIRSAKRPAAALEAKGGRTANGTAVSLYDANGTVAQAWTVTHEGDYVVIRNAKSGRAIDPTGPSSDPGTKLQLWDASGTRPQRWIAIRRDDGSYEFRSAMDPDAAFDLTSGRTSNGTRAQLYTANGTEAQSWALEAYELPETRADELASQHAGDLADGTYVIRSAKRPAAALEAKGGRTANGTAVSLYDANGTVAQAWTVTHEGDYVVIRNAKSGRAIDPTGPSSDPGTKLQLWDASGTRPQRWIAIRRDDGSYEFRSAMDPDAAFDLTSGRTSNGTRAQLYTANGTEAQSWLLSVSK